MILIANALTLLFCVRALLSWIPSPKVQHHPLYRLFVRLAEPLLEPIRKFVPTHQYGIDFSPAIAIVLIWITVTLLLMVLT